MIIDYKVFTDRKAKSRVLSYIALLDRVLLWEFFESVKNYNIKDFKLSSLGNKEQQFNKLLNDFNKNQNVRDFNSYPFDLFGTEAFLHFLSKQIQNIKNDFVHSLRFRLFIDIPEKGFPDLRNKIANIMLLRHYFIHNGNPQNGNIVIDDKVVLEKLDIVKAFIILFVFLPYDYANDIFNCIKAYCDNPDELKTILDKIDKNKKYVKDDVLKSNPDNNFPTYKDLLESDASLNKFFESYPYISSKRLSVKIMDKNFIGYYNIGRIEAVFMDLYKCKAAEFVKKKRKDKFYMEQIKSVFFLFIKIIEVIQRYFIFEFENDKDNTNKNYINIRNAVSHSDIFFYGENKQKYLDEFDKNIRDILSFFDEKKDRKSLKIEFLKSMDSLFAKRNNFKLKVVYDKTKDNHKNQIELYDVDVNFNEFLEQNDFSDFNKYSRKSVNNKIKEIINSILSDDNKNNRVQRKNISLVKYSYLLDLKKELRRILKKAKDDNYQQYNSCFQKKIG